MADSDQVLSQEEIDAMLNGGGGDSPAAVEEPPAAAVAEAPPPPPPPPQPEVQEAPATVPVTAPVAAPAAGGVGQEEIQALYQRIAALEASVQMLSSQGASGSSADIQQLNEGLQAMSSKTDGMMETLQATVGFGVKSVFTCKSCEAHGHVATKLTCTSCGTEEWWGWFPPPQE